MISDLKPSSVAFLGFRGENAFTQRVVAQHRDFYDKFIGNWEINSDWALSMQYDLIVCTRCSYFARDPSTFIRKCREHLTEDGRCLSDWGLGAHWKDFKFKVGWVRDDEHEWAYDELNKLHSCMWRTEFADDPEAREFWANVLKRFDYAHDASMDEIVRAEVPAIVDYECERVKLKFLWPESPQLYLISRFKK